MSGFDINDSQVREEYNGSNTKEVVVFVEPLKDNIKNKIYEYVNIMRDTNNENLYFSTFKKLKKLVGGFDNLPDAVISLGTLDEKGNPKVICITSTKNNGAKPKGNNKVYHTSDVKGINKLKGIFRFLSNLCRYYIRSQVFYQCLTHLHRYSQLHYISCP